MRYSDLSLTATIEPGDEVRYTIIVTALTNPGAEGFAVAIPNLGLTTTVDWAPHWRCLATKLPNTPRATCQWLAWVLGGLEPQQWTQCSSS